jgi:hypothetical protein
VRGQRSLESFVFVALNKSLTGASSCISKAGTVFSFLAGLAKLNIRRNADSERLIVLSARPRFCWSAPKDSLLC